MKMMMLGFSKTKPPTLRRACQVCLPLSCRCVCALGVGTVVRLDVWSWTAKAGGLPMKSAFSSSPTTRATVLPQHTIRPPFPKPTPPHHTTTAWPASPHTPRPSCRNMRFPGTVLAALAALPPRHPSLTLVPPLLARIDSGQPQRRPHASTSTKAAL